MSTRYQDSRRLMIARSKRPTFPEITSRASFDAQKCSSSQERAELEGAIPEAIDRAKLLNEGKHD